jgi:hypothetical protein
MDVRSAVAILRGRLREPGRARSEHLSRMLDFTARFLLLAELLCDR